MPDLLSNSERAEIRSALKDVTDTFFKTTITIQKYNSFSVDRFNEDREDREYTSYEVLGLKLERDQERDRVRKDEAGDFERGTIEVYINFDDLETAGLTEGVNHTISETEDYMIVEGTRYEIDYIIKAGPLDEKNVLIKIYGKPDIKKT